MRAVLPARLDQPSVVFYHAGAGTGVLEEPSARAATEARPLEGHRGPRQDGDIAHCMPQCFRHIHLEEVALLTGTHLPHSK
jgi:hypothetical protein